MGTIQRIAVVGCGWLGTPLAIRLTQQGYDVRGSRQHPSELPELEQAGISAAALQLNPHCQCERPDVIFAGAQLLIINIPPRRKQHDGDYHVAQIRALLKQVQQFQIGKVLLISSTSVYGSLQGEVDESVPCEPSTASGTTLLEVEQMLMSQTGIQASVLRFSGLIGPKRHPGRFLMGKTVDGADAPVNLIHQTDCIGLIEALIQRDVWGEIFNASCDEHPSKRLFYQAASRALGQAEPMFSHQAGSTKIIRNDLIKKTLSYSFQYPDPIAWIQR
ncbi:SDR family oxidoreductase [Celerinatantimonas sp. YJH-8]|uniref:SDR family oxidoreductase n=1 Tax=Celerinatantimonas sp. YJH-8 TaxID=3228714 RepID=UPI0038C72070